MMNVFNIFSYNVTAYSIGILIATIVGILIFVLLSKKYDLNKETWTYFSIFAIIFSIIFGRLFYFIARLEFYFYDVGIKEVFNINSGGYGIWGSILGIALASFITAKITKQDVYKLLSLSAVSGSISIAVGRFAEYFTSEGIGAYIENEYFMKFPFAISNEYGEWYWAIFVFEGITALIIFSILFNNKKEFENNSKLFLILFSSSQMFLESLRRDNFLRWLFVRVSQLTSMLVLVTIMIFATVFLFKRDNYNAYIKRIITSWFLMLISIITIVILEFAIDKSYLSNWIIYTIMCFMCFVAGMSCYYLSFYCKNK